MKPTVVCLMGPTAAGKTDLALQWVSQHPFDIVSVDSAMVYRGMDIGTAKPTAEQLQKFPHRLIDILDPKDAYSAADFCRDAKREINAIIKRGRTPLLVGGTMLYFRALQHGLSILPAADVTVRAHLESELSSEGIAVLFQRLQQIDPLAAARIKPNDKQRILRALEVYQLTGKPLSSLQTAIAVDPEYQFINTAILPSDRAILHQRIEQRFKQMIKQGFIEEVEKLRAREDLHIGLPAMRAVGYRHVWEYLEGAYDQNTLIEKGIAATRQLAKRQLTWLRSWSGIMPAENFTFNQ